MPTSNLETTIRTIVDEAVAKAVAAVQAHEGQLLNSVQEALDKARAGNGAATTKRRRTKKTTARKTKRSKSNGSKRRTVKIGRETWPVRNKHNPAPENPNNVDKFGTNRTPKPLR